MHSRRFLQLLVAAGLLVGRLLVAQPPAAADCVRQAVPDSFGRLVLPLCAVRAGLKPAGSQVAPNYPPQLVGVGIPGFAVLRFLVDTGGRVDTSSIQVVSERHPLFGYALRAAVRTWRFQPVRSAGRPVWVSAEQRATFPTPTIEAELLTAARAPRVSRRPAAHGQLPEWVVGWPTVAPDSTVVPTAAQTARALVRVLGPFLRDSLTVSAQVERQVRTRPPVCVSVGWPPATRADSVAREAPSAELSDALQREGWQAVPGARCPAVARFWGGSRADSVRARERMPISVRVWPVRTVAVDILHVEVAVSQKPLQAIGATCVVAERGPYAGARCSTHRTSYMTSVQDESGSTHSVP